MDNYYNLLTDSARLAYDSAVKEYGNMIISEAYSIAKQNNTATEIALSDIQEAKRQLSERNVNNHDSIHEESIRDRAYVNNNHKSRNYFNLRYERSKLIIYLIFIASVAYLVFGIVFFVIYRYKQELVFNPSYSVFGVGIIGILVSFFTYLLLGYKYKKSFIQSEIRKSREQNEMLYMLWHQIEEYGYQLQKDKNRDIYGFGVSSVIDYLSDLLKDQGDDLKLRKVLQIRNRLIYSDPDYLSPEEKEETILMAKDIVNMLEQKLIKIEEAKNSYRDLDIDN